MCGGYFFDVMHASGLQVCTHTYSGVQKRSVFSISFCFIALKHHLSLTWKLTILARLAAHGVPESACFSSQYCCYGDVPSHAINMGPGDVNWSPCAHMARALELQGVRSFWDKISCSPGWLWTQSSLPFCLSFSRVILKALTILCESRLVLCWDDKCVPPHPAWMLTSSNLRVFPLSCRHPHIHGSNLN